VREAFDKDYRLTVLSDACLDADEDIHRFLMEKIFPKQAEALTVKDCISRF
jgi:nicotinamidase-related amidase